MSHQRKGFFCGLLVLFFFAAAVQLGAAVVKVYPTMTRAQIQAVIDGAVDNTTIRFAAGLYDFSDTPFSVGPWNEGGALRVVDKSLKFIADKGVTLLGADSTLDPTTGIGTSGIIAFNVANSATKSVSFKGFTFSKFVIGIVSGIYNGSTFVPSAYDFTVQNCVFQNIHRNTIALTGVQRNIKIIGNTIASCLRMGLFLDWYWVGDNTGRQPATGSIKIQNNKIHVQNANAAAKTMCVCINRGNKKINIANNDFDAAGSAAQSFGIEISGGANAPNIANNDVTNVLYGLDLNGETSALGTFPLEGAKVTNNRIAAYLGIWSGNGTCRKNKFTNNKIHVTGTDAWGFATYGCFDDLITANKVSGSGTVAFGLQGYDQSGTGGPKADSTNEILKNNSVKNFVVEEGGVHYFCNQYTHANIIQGICKEHATYYDLGTNNIWKCVWPDTASVDRAARLALIAAGHSYREPLEK